VCLVHDRASVLRLIGYGSNGPLKEVALLSGHGLKMLVAVTPDGDRKAKPTSIPATDNFSFETCEPMSVVSSGGTHGDDIAVG
jgi:hypothetical protein